MATKSDRQKRIAEHLSRSTGDFSKSSLNSVQRKQQILEHIRSLQRLKHFDNQCDHESWVGQDK